MKTLHVYLRSGLLLLGAGWMLLATAAHGATAAPLAGNDARLVTATPNPVPPSIIFQRIAPPARRKVLPLADDAVALAAGTNIPTASSNTAPAKTFASITVEATVQIPSTQAGSPAASQAQTVLTWTTAAGRRLKAYSNVDFRVWESGPAAIETPTLVLSWLGFVFVHDGPPATFEWPAGLQLDPQHAEYAVDLSEAEMAKLAATDPTAFAALDALHAYYDAHRAELQTARTRLAATRAAAAVAAEKAAAVRRAEPPAPVVLQYWIPTP